jgi:hypothetical protein
MMSTELSVQPGSGVTSTASIVEVEASDDGPGRLFNRLPSMEIEDELTYDKLMMTEYDEDNVIVIDLTEERNASAKKEVASVQPRQMFNTTSEDERELEEEAANDDEVAAATEAMNGSDLILEDEEVAKLDLSTPPLQKTITQDVVDDIKGLVLTASKQPQMEAIVTTRVASGILPPVVPYKSVRNNNMNTNGCSMLYNNSSGVVEADPLEVALEAIAYSKIPQGVELGRAHTATRPKKKSAAAVSRSLQRSKTINVPDVPYNNHNNNNLHHQRILTASEDDLNGSSSYHEQVKAAYTRNTCLLTCNPPANKNWISSRCFFWPFCQ